MLTYFQIDPYMEMCQHGKTNINIYKISEYCKNWPNLAPVLIIWRKKYLSGESGGERKKYPSPNDPHPSVCGLFHPSFHPSGRPSERSCLRNSSYIFHRIHFDNYDLVLATSPTSFIGFI